MWRVATGLVGRLVGAASPASASGRFVRLRQQLATTNVDKPASERLACALPWATQRAYSSKAKARIEGLKYWKPTSPGQRFRVTVKRDGIWAGKPKRSLTRGVKRHAGRNDRGCITMRHQGGGHKKKLRLVDIKRHFEGLTGVVERLEYDPNRTGYLALIRYESDAVQAPAAPLQSSSPRLPAAATAAGSSSVSSAAAFSSMSASHGSTSAMQGSSLATLAAVGQPAGKAHAQYRYMLAPQGLNPGDLVTAGAGAALRAGNTLQLRDIPTGMQIYNLELVPGQGSKLCRAAGCAAVIMAKQEKKAIVRLPSGEQRLFLLECRATIGSVSNPQHRNEVIGKAGLSRWRGIRPTVRGIAMNPVDHPHGGRTNGGRPSCTPWGVPCKGFRTRRKHKPSNAQILVTSRQARGKN